MSERRKVLELFEANKTELQNKIDRGIEQNRKGDVRIRVVDKDGNPIKNATVHLDQKNHAFRFGANLFLLDEMETAEKNAKYREIFPEFFNMATLPFYWDATEPERGKTRYEKDSPRVYRRPAADLCIEYCEQNGIEPREHALAYDAFFPSWLYNASVDEVKAALENRYREISERYADKIPTIEVTNEMEWEKGKTKFYNEPDYVEWCFKLAMKYFPNNKLAINEWYGPCWEDRCRATDKYYSYTESAMLKGARIDAIAMQYHMFFKREEEYQKTRLAYDPASLYAHMDLYANLGKPLQISEITVPAYSNEPEDEQLQADILEYLYSIWFSHPAVEQIIYWNFVDGYCHVWNADQIREVQGNMSVGENVYYGGLLRFDLSPKPAFLRLKELIRTKWHTDETLTTDADGVACARGFFGEYLCTVEQNGKTVTVPLAVKKGEDNTYSVTV